MNLGLFIARKLYSDSDGKKQFSRPAVRIAMAGIAIGLIVMIVSVAVSVGFKREITNKVVGFGADIQVLNLSYMNEYDMSPVIATDSLLTAFGKVNGVDGVQKFSMKTGMLKTDDDFMGISLKGIGADYNTHFLEEYIKEGEMPDFSSDKSKSEIVISRLQANQLKLEVGDKVFAYFFSDDNIRARRFLIKAIYDTNLRDYDKMYAYTSLYTVNKLNGYADSCMAGGVELSVADFEHIDDVVSSVKNSVTNNIIDKNGCIYGAFSIKDRAPGIFSWLGVLDMNVIMIIVIMIFVASFTVVSGLLIIMLERINTIGTLKALGANNGMIRNVFVHFAVMIVGKGMLLGNVIGLALCYIQKYTGIVKLDASTYYLDCVPIAINWGAVAFLNVITFVLSVLVIIGGSHIISVNKTADSLRFE